MSAMSDRLLATLDAVTARDEVATEAMEKTALLPGKDYDPDTGEWMGEEPEGYRPLAEAPSFDTIENKDSKVPDFEKSDASIDYKRVRDTTYAMQEATLFMMGQAAKLAVSTEAPRAFTVFKELTDTMRGLNKDLMDNQKTFKTVIQGEDPPGSTTVSVGTDNDGNTTVTVAKTPRSSRDLLQMIEQARKDADKREKGKLQPTDGVIDVVADEVVEDKEDGISEA